MPPRATASRIVNAIFGLVSAVSLYAATYLPGPDLDLARRAPVIVRASVVSQESRLERVGDALRPFTIVNLVTLESIRGDAPEAISVRLPGGRVGGRISWIPGMPRFSGGSEVVLFLERAAGHPGFFRLTELGLSKFDLVTDDDGRRFAVRPAFELREDLLAAGRADLLANLSEKSAVPAREAGPFLAALRAVGQGRDPGDIAWRERSPGKRAKWVNIGGREPQDLFRWFWDTGASPNGVVTVVGTQTNLTNDDAAGCGTDSLCDVQHGVDEWVGVPSTDVHYSLPGGSTPGNVTVNLDAIQDFNGGGAWTTALGCGPGVIGLGGAGEADGPIAYRGDPNYFSPNVATVSMRKVTCTPGGYSARTFKTAVMHEIGHTLGLGHPNQDVSTHSTTTQADWDASVMHSSVPPSKPDAPQADDTQGIQYLYTTGSLGTLPTASFTFAPTAPTSGAPVAFTDASTGSPIAWTWDFGDGGTSMDRNPSHTFSAPGTFNVRLLVGSATGSGTTSKTVTIAPGTAGCVSSSKTLCLNGNRFSVTAAYRTNDNRSGSGTGIELTSDSGYFFFFNEANIEVVIKVLNACGINNAYWVFAAGLTNVDVTVTVTDTRTGAVETYHNPLGMAFAPVQDTAAFSTCP